MSPFNWECSMVKVKDIEAPFFNLLAWAVKSKLTLEFWTVVFAFEFIV